MSEKARLVVLISGFGSNLQAVIDAVEQGILPAQIAAVVSNKSAAYGLERARLAGIPAHVHAWKKDQARVEYDRQLIELLDPYRPDWIILAGWMRLFSLPFLQHFAGKVINVHPALPDMFPGTHSIERAFEAYQAGIIDHTGVMVHKVVDEGVDDGPLLSCADVPILVGDTLETLEARIHRVEHDLLVKTLQDLLVFPGPGS
jgi:phosphoribosylglycinamide formyltransferase 1